MSTPEQRLADLLEDWRDAERDLWLLRHVEVEEAERRAAQARRAYERARQESATQAGGGVGSVAAANPPPVRVASRPGGIIGPLRGGL